MSTEHEFFVSVEARAKFNYEPRDTPWDDVPHELKLKVGDIVKNISTQTWEGDWEGYWEGEVNGKRGIFPANYVEIINTTNNTEMISTSNNTTKEHDIQKGLSRLDSAVTLG